MKCMFDLVNFYDVTLRTAVPHERKGEVSDNYTLVRSTLYRFKAWGNY